MIVFYVVAVFSPVLGVAAGVCWMKWNGSWWALLPLFAPTALIALIRFLVGKPVEPAAPQPSSQPSSAGAGATPNETVTSPLQAARSL